MTIIEQMAKNNVMLMLPVTFAPPGNTGINPIKFAVRMKKNIVSRKGA